MKLHAGTWASGGRHKADVGVSQADLPFGVVVPQMGVAFECGGDNATAVRRSKVLPLDGRIEPDQDN